MFGNVVRLHDFDGIFGHEKVCAKIVPKLLTPEQMLQRKECCGDWKTSEESDEFLERVITGDESWIYDYDIELKSQSREWKHKELPRPKKSCKSKSKIKVMLLVFFLTAMELCTTNSHLRVKLSTQLSTWRF